MPTNTGINQWIPDGSVQQHGVQQETNSFTHSRDKPHDQFCPKETNHKRIHFSNRTRQKSCLGFHVGKGSSLVVGEAQKGDCWGLATICFLAWVWLDGCSPCDFIKLHIEVLQVFFFLRDTLQFIKRLRQIRSPPLWLLSDFNGRRPPCSQSFPGALFALASGG